MSHRTGFLTAAFATAAVLAAAAPAEASGRVRHSYSTDKSFGLGLMVGSPVGLSAKYFMDGGRLALGFGIGEDDYHHDDFYDDDGLSLHVDLLFHPVTLVDNGTVALPFYVGGGLRVVDHDDYCHRHDGFTHCHDDGAGVGIRVPLGMAIDFRRAPVDVFFELVPILSFFDDHDHRDRLDLTAALGARFWF